MTSSRARLLWRWFTLDSSRHVLELSTEVTPPGCGIELAIAIDAHGLRAKWRWSEDGRTIARPIIGVA